MAGKHRRVMPREEKILTGITGVLLTISLIVIGYMMISIGMFSLAEFILFVLACQVAAWVLCWFSDGIHFGFRRNHGKHRL